MSQIKAAREHNGERPGSGWRARIDILLFMLGLSVKCDCAATRSS